MSDIPSMNLARTHGFVGLGFSGNYTPNGRGWSLLIT